MRNKLKQLSPHIIPLCLMAYLLTYTMTLLGEHYTLGFNHTLSLPHKLFIIQKGKMPTKDQLIVFTPDYLNGKQIVKITGGIAGDEVTENDRSFYINGKYIGYAKKHDIEGNPTQIGFKGIIPKGKYFAYTPHKDSLDSKYKTIGLIDESNVIGSAIAIF